MKTVSFGRRFGWIVVIALVPSLLFAQKQIKWYQFDIIPGYIKEGPNKGKGFQDGIDEFIKKTLEEKGYQVVFETAAMARIIADFEAGKPVGSGGFIKNPELEKTMEFSTPHSLALGNSVIVLKSREKDFKPYLTKDGYINLEKVITQSKFKLGIATGRPYSGVIDEILLKYKDNSNIYSRAGSNISEGIMGMLMENRFDYTIMFPWEAKYIKETLEKKDEIVSAHIEGMPPYALIQAAVPKNEWGKQVLAIINPALQKYMATEEYHKVKEYWLDENSKVFYRKLFAEYFSK
ncbi:MAG: TIGR02285 family protein [Chitinivibrionales bacterium]|nr:TIGR02285 family protein [Chitinivibrionales bacterium]